MAEHPESDSPEHIPEEDIAAFLDNELPSRRREEVIGHLAICPSCRTIIAQSEQSKKSAPDPNRPSE